MKWLVRALALGAALALAFIGWGYWGATRPPIVVDHQTRLPGLPPGAELRVLLLADTHHGWPDMPPARLERIVARANALKPDLILLAGDYHGGKLIDWAPQPHLEPALRPFARLRAPLGVFAVTGNHDSLRWTRYVLAAQKSPVLLSNDHRDLGPLVVAGSNSLGEDPNIPATLAAIPPGKPILLLQHEGDYLHQIKPPPGRQILVLSGHTHGGQIVLPLVGSVGGLLLETACRRGPCLLNGWNLFVTSGLGTSWVPLRIGVPPEMVLLTLRG